VDGIGVVRYPDAVSGQLVTESYRPRAGHRRGFPERAGARRQLLWAVDGRIPDPLAVGRVQRREDLAAPAVEDGESLPLRTRLSDPGRERVQGADAVHRQAEAGAEATGGRDPDPQPGEGPRAEPDRDQVDRAPAPRRLGRALDLAQEPGRVPGPPLRGEPQLRLVEDLAVAPGTGDGVDRRGVEADDVQRRATP
jgi:hypothetical protein